jgi:transposase
MSIEQTQLYNRVLDWSQENNSFDFKQFHLIGKEFRKEMGFTSPAKMSQNTTIGMINSLKSFFALNKNGDKSARQPRRFKSSRLFTPFTFDWNNGGGGFKFVDDKLVILLKGKPFISIVLPDYAVKCLEEVDFSVATITFSSDNDEIYLSITLKDEINQKPSLNLDRWLSIDPGLTHAISLITCDGTAIKYQNNQYKNLERQISSIQSKLDKKKKYSRRYYKLKIAFKKISRKRANKNKDFQHKLTKEIVNFAIEKDIGQIFYGDIQVKSLTKSRTANKGLNKSTQNRGTLRPYQVIPPVQGWS